MDYESGVAYKQKQKYSAIDNKMNYDRKNLFLLLLKKFLGGKKIQVFEYYPELESKSIQILPHYLSGKGMFKLGEGVLFLVSMVNKEFPCFNNTTNSKGFG